MECHGTIIRSRQFACLALILLVLRLANPITILGDEATAPGHAKPQSTPIVRAFRNDAALNDITFANKSAGWAVGDRGVIWHTDDGGATWHQQESPVSCALNAVFFLDVHRGWAIGGQCQPYTNATRGVVLRTDDGGATWLHLPQPLVPLLTGVKFFDRDHGIAFGQSASYYPSGVFNTHDGGNTWQPLPADEHGTWLAGDFLEPDAGALAGPDGRIATLVRRKVVSSPLGATSLRSFRAMQLVGPTGGWAVGDGGLLLTTSDLGHSWQTPPVNLPDSIVSQFDFRAVAVEGNHVWIAGSPGTRIFRSPDGGKTWQAATTGQTAPIHALRFIDSQRGWAVGALGNILATHDGGQSWQMQRSGGKRAALLAIFARPTDVPLELLADSGAADGYISAVDILCSPSDDGNAAARETASMRSHEALLLAGAAAANTAWQFPLPPADLGLAPDDLLKALNRENDGRAIQQIESHLVRELRMWRPNVVVIPHLPAPTADKPLSHLIEQIVQRAVIAASDTNQQTELATDAGLAPWQVQRVFGFMPPDTRGDESIDTSHFSPWLGATFADFASPARRLLFTSHTPLSDAVELKLLMSGVPQDTNARGIFTSIALAPGTDARRRLPVLPAEDLDAFRRLAVRRRMLEHLLQRNQGNAAWAAQVNQLIDGLSDDDTGQLLSQLAEGYRKAGRLDLAADTYFLLARRTPDHPLVDPALTWLVEFYASDEIAHRLATRSATNIRATNSIAVDRSPAAENISGDVQQASAITPITSAAPPAATLSRDDRLHRAVQLADYFKKARPALYAEPAVRFAAVTAERRLGYANPAKYYYLALRELPETDAWRQCGATEEWLDKPGNTPPPKKLATCRRTVERPHLDGKLDEPLWQTADRLFLRNGISPPRSGKGSDAAEVRLTHDNEFLYLAVHCPKFANLDYKTDETPRPRDADLTHHDRVSIRLDIDRDYTTAYELTVDNRGWTHDACWGDATWNPTWYVASASDDTSWTIEAAIPLAELVDKPPASRDVWALAVRRTIPRTGYQTWSAAPTRDESDRGKAAATDAASDDSPAQFGLLIFE